MFITLEGPEGSGKNFSDPPSGGILKIRRVNLLSTREPGGTAIGDQVRSILMSMENQAMHRVQKFSCFAPPVPRLVEQVIRPNWRRGELCSVTGMLTQPWLTRDTGTAWTWFFSAACSISPPAVFGRT